MEAAFHGAAVITLDAKGRVAIPTRHRAALLQAGKSLVLTAHPDGCVLIYPVSEWEQVRARVAAFPSMDPVASWWKRLLVGFEEHVSPDGSGRILLSPALRLHAKRHRMLAASPVQVVLECIVVQVFRERPRIRPAPLRRRVRPGERDLRE